MESGCLHRGLRRISGVNLTNLQEILGDLSGLITWVEDCFQECKQELG
jgi:hypothetical protein